MYGIYEFIKHTSKRNSSGHRLSEFRCSRCKEVFLKREDMLINTPTNICTHVDFRGIKIKPFDNKRVSVIYSAMLNRCYNTNNKDYRYYGGKGISVCNEWYVNSVSFEKWATANGYMDTLTIDRIDSTKDYSPSNCRWVDRSFNSRFKSTTNTMTINGMTKTGRQWSEYIDKGINHINRKIRKDGIEETINYIKSIIN